MFRGTFGDMVEEYLYFIEYNDLNPTELDDISEVSCDSSNMSQSIVSSEHDY